MSSGPTDPLAARPTRYFASDSNAGRSIGNQQVQRASPATPLGLVGEFTPELGEEEVEILWISLASTMGDVISVRARPDGDRIAYEVVDEYDGAFEPGIRSSSQPLTGHEVGQLLRGLVCHDLGDLLFHDFFEKMAETSNHTETPESVAAGHAFVSLQSDFYPDLNPWLAEWYREWLGEQTNRAAPEG